MLIIGELSEGDMVVRGPRRKAQNGTQKLGDTVVVISPGKIKVFAASSD